MKERIYYMDYLRAIAIIGVLILHAATPYVSMYNKVDYWTWETGVIYNASVRWCVNIFLMISGALLLGRREEPLVDFFKKRANKILIPFIAWSVIYYIWRAYMWDLTFSLKQFVVLFSNNGIYYHLWYFYALFGIYLLAPMLNAFVTNASAALIRYVAVLWVIFYGGFRYFSYIVSNKFTLFFPLSEYVGMFLLGYYFAKFEQTVKVRAAIYVAGIIGAVSTVWQTNSLTADQGVFSGYAFQYSSPNVIAMSIALFVFFKYTIRRLQQEPNFAPGKIVKIIASTSFGVYLVHPILLDKLRPLFHEGITTFMHPVIGIPLQTLIILVGSVIIAWGIGKIPFIRRII